MITYSTNWMGPINQQWIEEHGNQWSAGRIDIYGVPNEPFPLEYGLAPMHSEDWNKLSNFLDNFGSELLLSYDELIETYEEHTGTKIRWLQE